MTADSLTLGIDESDESGGVVTADATVEDSDARDALDVIPLYNILSYGADLDVEGLVRRLEHGDIEIPTFQRGFVWTFRQASRFIESLLVGLPVPGVFFWNDPESKRLVVVDGQQRLRTLQTFYQGTIHDKVFKLPDKTSAYQTVHPSFQGKTYRSLDPEHRRVLDNTIIHATIVQQVTPSDEDSSIFYMFERINAEGSPLQPQEIRSAIYRNGPGGLAALLAGLNAVPAWRTLYGPLSSRMKDQELILRFFALTDAVFADTAASSLPDNAYARPMKEFLNRYSRRHRSLSEKEVASMGARFTAAVETILDAVGPRAFRPQTVLNAAVYDSVMVAIDRRLRTGHVRDPEALATAHRTLLGTPAYQAAYSRSTADAESVKNRIDLAIQAFATVR